MTPSDANPTPTEVDPVTVPDGDLDTHLEDSLDGSPARVLGAAAAVPCDIWSSDFRERLAEDSPLREGFEEADSKSELDRLGGFHEAALRITTVER